MKWSRVPPLRCRMFAPRKAAPWSAIALIVASSFDGCVVKPGNDRGHQHAGVDAGVAQLANGAQPLQRMRGAGLERAPGVFVDRRHADAHRAFRHAPQLREQVGVAHDHRSLRDEADWRARRRPALRAIAA